MKIFALHHRYFIDFWNLFDFLILLLSIAHLFLVDLVERYFISPALLRVFKLAKLGRVLRLVKASKGLRALLTALSMALPGMLSLGLLLLIVILIFSIFGTLFFKNVKPRGDFNNVYNFNSFSNTLIVLVALCTGDGFDGALNAVFDDTDCRLEDSKIGEVGNCGNFGGGIIFMVLYLILS